MTETQPEYLIIGRIAGPFGVRGEVKMELLGEFPDRYLKLKRFFGGGGPDGSVDRREYTVLGGRQRTVKDQLLFRLEGITTPEQVDALRGQFVQIPASDAPPLGEGEYYAFQLIGLDVRLQDGSSLGPLKEVLPLASSDVYVVTPSDPTAKLREYLIPALKDVIKEINLAERYMVVEPLDGMLE